MRSVTKISPEDHLQYTHSYDEVDWEGRSLTSTLITGEKICLGWDLLGRLTGIETSCVAESIPEGGYDPLGNLLTVSFTSTWGSQTEQYCYDDLNQLIHEDCVASHDYQHDSLHNRLAKDQSVCVLAVSVLNSK